MDLENRNHSVAESIWCMMKFGKGEDGWVCNARPMEWIRNARSFENTGYGAAQFSKKYRSVGGKDCRGERN